MTIPIGRAVSDPYYGDHGTVVKWEPWNKGCDTLLELADGRRIWCAMHTLRALDGAPLPDSAEARKIGRAAAHSQLKAIRAQHIRDFHKPWPGAEFAKVLIGRAIDQAIEETTP